MRLKQHMAISHEDHEYTGWSLWDYKMTKLHVRKIVHPEIAIFFDGNGGETSQLIFMITRHNLCERATIQMRWLQNKFPV